MLRIVVSGEELFDETTQEFSYTEDTTLDLEHSLVSVSKWEAKYQKPFLAQTEKSEEEVFGYIEAMLLSPDISRDVLLRLSQENIQAINDYIGSPQSATTIYAPDAKAGKSKSETITAELMYYWMVSFTIPFECETWHLNRLLNLLQICSIKNSKPQKMSRSEMAARNRALNEQRKAQMGTTG